MTRRAFLPAAAASTLAAGNAAAADAAKNVILELRRIQLRNSADNQRQRNNDFLKQQVAALQRAGAGPTGVFASNIAPDGPFLLVLASYAVARRDGADAGQARRGCRISEGARRVQRATGFELRADGEQPAARLRRLPERSSAAQRRQTPGAPV